MNNLELIQSATIRNDFGMLTFDFGNGIEGTIYYPQSDKRKSTYAFNLIHHGRVRLHIDGLSMADAFDGLADAVRSLQKTLAAWSKTLDRHARA